MSIEQLHEDCDGCDGQGIAVCPYCEGKGEVRRRGIFVFGRGQTQKVSKLQWQGEGTLSCVTVVHKVIGMLAE